MAKPKKKAVESEGLGDIDLNMGSFGESDALDIDTDLSDPVPDPLEAVEYSGNCEQDTPKEMSAILDAFKSRAKDESNRAREATDSLHWFAVSFQTREQMKAFLAAAGWTELLDDQYIDGLKVAKLEGIDLPPANLRYQGEKIDRKIADLPCIED